MADLSHHVERAHERVALMHGEVTDEMIDRGAAALVKGGVVCDPVTGDVLHDHDWTPMEAAETVLRAALAFPKKGR